MKTLIQDVTLTNPIDRLKQLRLYMLAQLSREYFYEIYQSTYPTFPENSVWDIRRTE